MTSTLLALIAGVLAAGKYKPLVAAVDPEGTKAEPVIVLLPLIAPTTSNGVVGVVLPIPTLPELRIRIASVPPLLPVWKMMSAPVVPTPDVERKVSGDVVVAPPITKGVMIDVVKVGLVAIATAVPEPESVYSPSTPALL